VDERNEDGRQVQFAPGTSEIVGSALPVIKPKTGRWWQECNSAAGAGFS
jgi:hypothetical protein